METGLKILYRFSSETCERELRLSRSSIWETVRFQLEYKWNMIIDNSRRAPKKRVQGSYLQGFRQQQSNKNEQKDEWLKLKSDDMIYNLDFIIIKRLPLSRDYTPYIPQSFREELFEKLNSSKDSSTNSSSEDCSTQDEEFYLKKMSDQLDKQSLNQRKQMHWYRRNFQQQHFDDRTVPFISIKQRRKQWRKLPTGIPKLQLHSPKKGDFENPQITIYENNEGKLLVWNQF